MISRYRKAVLKAYRKQIKGRPPLDNLRNPTRAKLKDECIKVYDTRPLGPNDRGILSAFLGIPRELEDYTSRIAEYDDGKFRPLDKFLKGETEDPNVRNLDLLAWMIDFPLRPFSVWVINPPEDNIFIKILDKIKSVLPVLTKRRQTLFYISAGIPVVVIVYLSLIDNSKPCMYWTGDHYERISCDQDTITSAIAYNEKTAQMRKITRPDTLTKNALGSVWYFKVKSDSADFFTAAGEYPLDRERVLRPLTDYMLRKYVLDKKEPAGGMKEQELSSK